jgi:hypothetical protein
LSIASNIINIVVLIIQRYSFITTLFLGPFDDVITKFYCSCSVFERVPRGHIHGNFSAYFGAQKPSCKIYNVIMRQPVYERSLFVLCLCTLK